MDTCDGQAIFAAIKDVLLRLNIDITLCRGITLDGAAAMQSEAVGVVIIVILRLSHVWQCIHCCLTNH